MAPEDSPTQPDPQPQAGRFAAFKRFVAGTRRRVLISSTIMLCAVGGVVAAIFSGDNGEGLHEELSVDAVLAGDAIEAAFGRRRTKKYGPRTLDLDLLDYDGLIRTGEEGEGALILPHPGIAMREFVLRPLSDVEPEWRHPLTGESAESLLAKVEKPEVTPIDAGWAPPAA